MKILLGLVLAGAMAWGTSRRAVVWESEEVLWEEAVRVSPEMPRPHLNLGLEYEKADQYDAALNQFHIALLMSQTTNRMAKHQRMSEASAQSNIALIYLVKGQWQDAIRRSNAAIEAYPELKTSFVNRGTAYLAMGRCHDAIADYMKVGIRDLPRCD